MSDVWTLCPISKPAMERCVANAGSRNERNKWLEEFKKKHTDSEFGKKLYRLIKETGDALDQKEVQEPEEEKFEQAEEPPGTGEELPENAEEVPKKHEEAKGEKIKENAVMKGRRILEPEDIYSISAKDLDDFIKLLETDPNWHIDMLFEDSKLGLVLYCLAERLPQTTVGKICKQLFETENIDPSYINEFYTDFFPSYFKHPYSSFSLDLLIKACKAYPDEFHTLLKTLLQDRMVSNKMMDDFVATMDYAGKLEFLNIALELELDTPEFVHNITSILEAYKACEKSEMVQMYVYNCLLKHASQCLTDLNYGRFMLTYLQAVDALGGKLNFMCFERMIKIHRSPFKRPCMNLFVEMMEKASEEHMYPNVPKIQGFED